MEQNTEDRKQTIGKLRTDLVDPLATVKLAEVFEFGAAKYKEFGWREGVPFSKILGAIHRHLISFELGEAHAQDSNLHHLAHVMANCSMILRWIEDGKIELDDRPFLKHKESFHNE